MLVFQCSDWLSVQHPAEIKFISLNSLQLVLTIKQWVCINVLEETAYDSSHFAT